MAQRRSEPLQLPEYTNIYVCMYVYKRYIFTYLQHHKSKSSLPALNIDLHSPSE